jgi:hypothetical protein
MLHYSHELFAVASWRQSIPEHLAETLLGEDTVVLYELSVFPRNVVNTLEVEHLEKGLNLSPLIFSQLHPRRFASTPIQARAHATTRFIEGLESNPSSTKTATLVELLNYVVPSTQMNLGTAR